MWNINILYCYNNSIKYLKYNKYNIFALNQPA